MLVIRIMHALVQAEQRRLSTLMGIRKGFDQGKGLRTVDSENEDEIASKYDYPAQSVAVLRCDHAALFIKRFEVDGRYLTRSHNRPLSVTMQKIVH